MAALNIQKTTNRISTVAATFLEAAQYPSNPPFHPHEQYPEYPFRSLNTNRNETYAGVRETFRLLGLDSQNFGSSSWNPLKDIVHPGDCVLLKPNFIKEYRVDKQDEWLQIITHGSVIRAVADYVFLALKGQGRLVLADGPQTDSSFQKIVAKLGIGAIQSFYQADAKLELEVYDLRNEQWCEQDGVYVGREKLRGDPSGVLLIDLKEISYFQHRRTTGAFYGAFYDVEETNKFHNNGHHTYAFCRTPLLADVVIHLPKLKTHKKCGLTANLKGLVGLNGNKNLLPHYTFGYPASGGDQFKEASPKRRLENLFVGHAKKYLAKGTPWALELARNLKGFAYRAFGETSSVIRSGNWHGNDTVWRMALDLNTILTFADKHGVLKERPQRRFFSVVDGIIAGEGNGPLEASAKSCGIIVAGEAPEIVDVVCARLMGFDYAKIPLLSEAVSNGKSLSEFNAQESIQVVSNRQGVDSGLFAHPERRVFEFEPHFGWKGHIELAG
jgi:uncharacterized protein (DUF362 family)